MEERFDEILALFIFELHLEKQPPKKKKRKEPLEVEAVSECVSHFAAAGTTGLARTSVPSRPKTLTAPLKTPPEEPQQLLKELQELASPGSTEAAVSLAFALTKLR